MPETCHDGDARARQPEHSYESVWMGHWKQRSCNTASRFRNCFALHDGSKEENCNTTKGETLVQSADPRKAARLDILGGPSNASDYRNTWRGQQGSLKVASDVPSSSKGDGVETEDEGKNITYNKLAMDSRILRSARSERHSFPMSSFNQNYGSVLTPMNELAYRDRNMTKSQINDNHGHVPITVRSSGTNSPSRLCRLASSEVEFSSQNHYLLPESITQSPILCGKSSGSVEKKSFPIPKPFLYDLPSTSYTVKYKYKSGGTPVRSFMYRNQETDQSIYPVASKGHSTNSSFTPLVLESSNYCSYPKFWGCNKEKDNQLKAKDSGSCSSQKDGSLQINDPSASNFKFLISVGEESKETNGVFGTGVSSCCRNHEGGTKLEEFNLRSHLLQKMPACSIHDEDTLRICTTVDSVEGLPGGPPKLSETTHHLLITKKTGANLSKWDQIIRESKLSADFEGKALHGLLSLPSCGKRGSKLLSVGNTTNSKDKEETNTMDIDDCDARNSSQGISSSPSNEDFVVGQNGFTAQATLVSRKKVGTRESEIDIPDNSVDHIAVLAAKGSTGKRDFSSLRTKSLDVEVSHDDPPLYLNSTSQQDVPEAQPSNKLVKRLKLSPPSILAHGMISSRTGDKSSGEKVNKFFTKIMSYNISSSEPTFSKHVHQRQMNSDRSVVLFRNLEPSSMGSVKEQQDLDLSHPWIQRWCHSQVEGQLKKSPALLVCEPQVLKPTSRKKLPSIAAMALMGKASNRYRPCEFRKRGPVIVWKTEGF